MEKVTGGPVDKQQCRVRIEQQVAERVEVAVAVEVRDGQRFAADRDETWTTAAVADVNAAIEAAPGAGFAATAGGDKKRVGCHYQGSRRIIERTERLWLTRSRRAALPEPRLDVLRAVPETLLHRNRHPIGTDGLQGAVGSVATPRGEVDAQ